MIHRLPENCSLVIDRLANAWNKYGILGVNVGITPKGRNVFELSFKICNNDESMEYISSIKFYYTVIHVQALNSVFENVYPDFVLKPNRFISIDELSSKYKLNKEEVATEILKSLKCTMQQVMKVDCYNRTDLYRFTRTFIDNIPITDTFKNFTEFLIWIDLH